MSTTIFTNNLKQRGLQATQATLIHRPGYHSTCAVVPSNTWLINCTIPTNNNSYTAFQRLFAGELSFFSWGALRKAEAVGKATAMRPHGGGMKKGFPTPVSNPRRPAFLVAFLLCRKVFVSFVPDNRRLRDVLDVIGLHKE